MTDAPPATFNPSIDTEQAGRLLRRIEAHHAGTGWHIDGGHLWVYVIYDHHDVTLNHHISRIMSRMGAPVRNSRYTAQPVLAPRHFQQSRHPTDRGGLSGLRRFVMNMAYADPAALDDSAEHLVLFRQLLREPGIVGFAACYEASGYKAGTPNLQGLMQLAQTTGASLEALPGALDVRIAVLVDVHDRAHIVRRWRGEHADLIPERGRGNATTSLRILMDVARNRTPEPADFEARYPDAGIRYDFG